MAISFTWVRRAGRGRGGSDGSVDIVEVMVRLLDYKSGDLIRSPDKVT
jgi:hypothetical protein